MLFCSNQLQIASAMADDVKAWLGELELEAYFQVRV
jgi:hypothetical protein